MVFKAREADYSAENPNKQLNIDSLIESIHEYFDPRSDHDNSYLLLRIKLLCEFFEIGESSANQNSEVITRLLKGAGSLTPLNILPFDGAIEVPTGIDTSAHIEIHNKLADIISQTKANFYEIQHAYLVSVITNSVQPHLRENKIPLSELIELGLPEFDPGSDEMDY